MDRIAFIWLLIGIIVGSVLFHTEISEALYSIPPTNAFSNIKLNGIWNNATSYNDSIIINTGGGSSSSSISDPYDYIISRNGSTYHAFETGTGIDHTGMDFDVLINNFIVTNGTSFFIKNGEYFPDAPIIIDYDFTSFIMEHNATIYCPSGSSMTLFHLLSVNSARLEGGIIEQPYPRTRTCTGVHIQSTGGFPNGASFNTLSKMSINNMLYGIILEVDVAGAYVNGNYFEGLVMNSNINAIHFRPNGLLVTQAEANQNSFIDIQIQNHPTFTNSAVTNVFGNSNNFVSVVSWDMRVGGVSMNITGQGNNIIGGSLTTQGFDDQGVNTQILDNIKQANFQKMTLDVLRSRGNSFEFQIPITEPKMTFSDTDTVLRNATVWIRELDGSQPTLKFDDNQDKTTVADNDAIMFIEVQGNDDAGNDNVYARIQSQAEDVTNNQEDGGFLIQIQTQSGSPENFLRMNNAGGEQIELFKKVWMSEELDMQDNPIVDPNYIKNGSNILSFPQGASQTLLGNQSSVHDLGDTAAGPCTIGQALVWSGSSFICQNIWLDVFKSADETITNDATLSDDGELLFAVESNSHYAYQMFLQFHSAATPDLQYRFTVPTGTVGFTNEGQWNAQNEANTNPITQTYTITTDNTDEMIMQVGYIDTSGTSGNVILQWAQAISDAGATTLYKGSYIMYKKIG